MLKLPNISLVTINTDSPNKGLAVLKHCAALVEFGEIIMFTHKPLDMPSNIKLQLIDNCNYVQYNQFIVRELAAHIKTDFVLIVQTDGFILNVDKWKPEFLNYDYIGAPWPIEWNFPQRVGNGGFCLRSKKFLTASAALDNIDSNANGENRNEDAYLCKTNYNKLINMGIRFAPVELAADFSLEAFCSDCPRTYADTFGFHGSPKNYPTQGLLDRIRDNQ